MAGILWGYEDEAGLLGAANRDAGGWGPHALAVAAPLALAFVLYTGHASLQAGLTAAGEGVRRAIETTIDRLAGPVPGPALVARRSRAAHQHPTPRGSRGSSPGPESTTTGSDRRPTASRTRYGAAR